MEHNMRVKANNEDIFQNISLYMFHISVLLHPVLEFMLLCCQSSEVALSLVLLLYVKMTPNCWFICGTALQAMFISAIYRNSSGEPLDGIMSNSFYTDLSRKTTFSGTERWRRGSDIYLVTLQPHLPFKRALLLCLGVVRNGRKLLLLMP